MKLITRNADLTAGELERRAANVLAHAGGRRGATEAVAEARRQFGFQDHGDALYWLDEAEVAAALITPREMAERMTIRQDKR